MRINHLIGALAGALISLCPLLAPAGEPTVRHMDLGDGVAVTLVTEPFDPDGRAIVLCASRVPCVVDGVPVFGTDGALPTREIKALRVIYGGHSADLDHTGMFNAWSPFDDDRPNIAVIHRDADGLRLRGEFSDGSAAYVAEWMVRGDASIRTRIDCQECLDPAAFPERPSAFQPQPTD